MIYFLAIYALTALVGLFGAAAASDFGLGFFSWALMLFGVVFGLATVKNHYDAQDAAR